MSKKCKAYSRSGLGRELPDSRKAFYAGWDAALAQSRSDEKQPRAGGTLAQPQPSREPLPYDKNDMEGLDANQRLGFKLGWKSAEAAHGITGSKT